MRQPRGDRTPNGDRWSAVLGHRSGAERSTVVARFVDSGVDPEMVERVLADGGDALYEAAASGRADWAEAFGGSLPAALLAAEVSALAAHLNSRASGIRALAVDDLLDDYSAVTVAAALGVSRQKVYEIARGGLAIPYIERVPWSQP